MTRKTRIIISILIIAVVAAAAGWFFINAKKDQTTPLPPKNGIIVAFGDSLTAGIGATDTEGEAGKLHNDLPSQLSRRIGIEIINKGHSGDTTQAALDRIDDVIALDPGTVIVLLGGNDYLRRVPIDTTFANLTQIIQTFKQHDIRVVLLGVRGGLLNDIFEDRFAQLAKEQDVPFVPNVLDGILDDKALMFDAIHPNNAGYAIIADKVAPVLKNAVGM